MPEFVPFPKLARLRREVTITEKIDGTNAAVCIGEDGAMWAQSRKRIITPQDDNFGFARWVAEHEDELGDLGPGVHFGEWYGLGIQRGYGLDHKRFALFNTSRWSEVRPACCHVVPILVQHTFADAAIDAALNTLRVWGSQAAPGFKNAEGIVVYHHGSRMYFKATLENDELPKSLAEAA